MPVIIDKAHILEHPEHLEDMKWLAEFTRDLIWSPGMTQSALEENLRLLRECYKERNIDAVFLTFFPRLMDVFPRSEEFEKTGLRVRMPYTKDDFLYSDAPYKEIAAQKTRFGRDQVTAQLAEIAKSLGVTGFKHLCAQYDRGLEEQVSDGRHLAFPLANTDEVVRLDPGEWHIDQSGIWKPVGLRDEYACTHPIAPVKRLTNIDTGMEKLMIAYERGGRVRYLIRDKQALFDSKKIIELSAVGIAVTSKTAGNLSQFL